MAAVNRRTVHPGAAHVESGGGARGVSVSPWGHGTYCLRAGDLPGHHLHPGAGRIPLPGGDHGLVEPVRAVVGAGQHAGGRVLRGHAAGGPRAARDTGDLEHRLGQPVHGRGLPWRATRGRRQDQHGRPGAADPQPLHRAAVEVAGVRGGVPGGAGGGTGHGTSSPGGWTNTTTDARTWRSTGEHPRRRALAQSTEAAWTIPGNQ